MRRAIFGGSFDPVHLGHLIVASAAADALALDRVHFVPAHVQPFKTDRQHASAADRVAMLRAALPHDERFVLDTREIDREGVSYTVDTLRAFAAEYPGDGLSLLVGADAARDLPEWREASAIPQLADVVVLTRPGEALPPHELVGRTLSVPAVDVSATQVRARVRQGEPLDELVPAAVAQYIESHRLYRTGD
jgi:nicotinate-nucleotide adenylyltransferase